MSKTLEYITCAEGWIAGKYRPQGASLWLTPKAAKYENVTLKAEAEKSVDPTIPEPAKAAPPKRGRARK